MTLEELNIIFNGKVEPLMKAIGMVQKAIQPIAGTVSQTSQKANDAVQQASNKAKKAIESTSSAEQKSTEASKRATTERAKQLEEIATIAERAAKRYNAAISGTSNGGPVSGPTPLAQKKAPTASPVKKSFDEVKAAAPAAASAVQPLIDKLDIINAKADIQRKKLEQLRAEYRKLSTSPGPNSTALDGLNTKIVNTEARFQSLSAQSDNLAAKIREVESGCKATGTAATKASSGANKLGNSFSKAKTHASGFGRELSMMRRQLLSSILIYGVALKGITAFGTYMMSALKTNSQFSASLNNLKASLLTAFNPIYQACLPALNSLINSLAKVAQYIGAFMSGFFGKSYASSVKSAAGLNSNVKALEDMDKAAKKSQKTLAGFDEINTIGNKSDASAAPAGKDKSLVGTDFGSMKPLISEEQISSAEAAGERIRAIFERIHGFAQKYKGPIIAAITGIAAAFLVFKTITFVSGIITGISTALSILAANPVVAAILAIVAVIAAVAAGIKYLYDTNEGFRNQVNGMIDGIKTTFMTVYNAIAPKLQEAWKNIQTIANNIYNTIIKPFTDHVQKSFQELWDKHLKPLWDKIQPFIEQISKGLLDLWNNVIYPIVNAFITVVGPVISSVLGTIWDVISSVFGMIADVIGGIMEFLGGLIDFIVGIFTGDWSRAWNGLVQMFKGIIDTIGGIFKGVINVIIDILNGFVGVAEGLVNGIIGGINMVSGKLGIQAIGTVTWGRIPKLAHGGITAGMTYAAIGDNPGGKEAVLPLSSNTEWMDTLANKLASKVGGSDTPVNISVYLDKNGSLIDTISTTIKRNSRNSNAPAFV